MKNIEFLNICYKYFNRFITAKELVTKLENIDKSKLSQNDINIINNILNEINKIIIDNPNKKDEYVIKQKNKIKHMIDKMEKINNIDNNDMITNQINNLKQDYSKEIDCYELWFKITSFISDNDYFNKTFESLNDYELLEFIAQNICAPFPPNLSQEEFNKLAKVGIEKDEREYLWRLAFNYENMNIDLTIIEDYFIKVKDGYYLVELISAVGKKLDIDKMIEKINDKDLINYLNENKSIINHFIDDNQFNKLLNKIL